MSFRVMLVVLALNVALGAATGCFPSLFKLVRKKPRGPTSRRSNRGPILDSIVSRSMPTNVPFYVPASSNRFTIPSSALASNSIQNRSSCNPTATGLANVTPSDGASTAENLIVARRTASCLNTPNTAAALFTATRSTVIAIFLSIVLGASRNTAAALSALFSTGSYVGHGLIACVKHILSFLLSLGSLFAFSNKQYGRRRQDRSNFSIVSAPSSSWGGVSNNGGVDSSHGDRASNHDYYTAAVSSSYDDSSGHHHHHHSGGYSYGGHHDGGGDFHGGSNCGSATCGGGS